MKSKLFILMALLISASLIFSACQPPPASAPAEQPAAQEPAATEPAAPEPTAVPPTDVPPAPEPTAVPVEKILTAVNGPTDVASLDPSILQDARARQVANAIYGGITFIDEETSEVLPNLAEKWDVSADATVYTFHLRKDVPWVKYNASTNTVEKTDRMVTANDYKFAMLRTLTAETGSPYAYLDAWNIAGAQAFNKGEAEADTVGIKVIDDYTLEITFVQPQAFNTSIAGMSMNYAEPSWLIEAHADKWTDPANIETFGPFALKEWVHDDRIVLVKNPFWPGTEGVPQAKLDVLELLFRDVAPAMSEYEAGNIDWVSVPSADIDRVKADSVLSAEFTTSPRATTYYYLLNVMSPFTDDVRVRKALSYAVDRQSIVDFVTKGGEQPARTQIHPSLAGAPDLEANPDLGPNYDPEFAKAQLDEYLAEKGITAADVDLTLAFNSDQLNQNVAEAIQQMWKDALGIDVKLSSVEAKVYWAQLDTPDMPQISRMGWGAVYFDADYFIKAAFKSGGMNNEVDENGNPSGGVRWKNAEFDAVVDQAAAELDEAKRKELYTRAETIISEEDVIYIPIYYYSYPQLTKPYVTARTFSVGGVEAYEDWDVDMEAKLAAK